MNISIKSADSIFATTIPITDGEPIPTIRVSGYDNVISTHPFPTEYPFAPFGSLEGLEVTR